MRGTLAARSSLFMSLPAAGSPRPRPSPAGSQQVQLSPAALPFAGSDRQLAGLVTGLTTGPGGDARHHGRRRLAPDRRPSRHPRALGVGAARALEQARKNLIVARHRAADRRSRSRLRSWAERSPPSRGRASHHRRAHRTRVPPTPVQVRNRDRQRLQRGAASPSGDAAAGVRNAPAHRHRRSRSPAPATALEQSVDLHAHRRPDERLRGEPGAAARQPGCSRSRAWSIRPPTSCASRSSAARCSACRRQRRACRACCRAARQHDAAQARSSARATAPSLTSKRSRLVGTSTSPLSGPTAARCAPAAPRQQIATPWHAAVGAAAVGDDERPARAPPAAARPSRRQHPPASRSTPARRR